MKVAVDPQDGSQADSLLLVNTLCKLANEHAQISAVIKLQSKSNIFDGHYVHVHASTVLSAREDFPQRSTVEIYECKWVN